MKEDTPTPNVVLAYSDALGVAKGLTSGLDAYILDNLNQARRLYQCIDERTDALCGCCQAIMDGKKVTEYFTPGYGKNAGKLMARLDAKVAHLLSGYSACSLEGLPLCRCWVSLAKLSTSTCFLPPCLSWWQRPRRSHTGRDECLSC